MLLFSICLIFLLQGDITKLGRYIYTLRFTVFFANQWVCGTGCLSYSNYILWPDSKWHLMGCFRIFSSNRDACQHRCHWQWKWAPPLWKRLAESTEHTTCPAGSQLDKPFLQMLQLLLLRAVTVCLIRKAKVVSHQWSTKMSHRFLEIFSTWCSPLQMKTIFYIFCENPMLLIHLHKKPFWLHLVFAFSLIYHNLENIFRHLLTSDTHPLKRDFLKLIFNFCTIDLRIQKMNKCTFGQKSRQQYES